MQDCVKECLGYFIICLFVTVLVAFFAKISFQTASRYGFIAFLVGLCLIYFIPELKRILSNSI